MHAGLSHLREAKAALTEKVIAYEALILKLSLQMRAATEKGDDVGGRVMALTTEMDTLVVERVALDRRLQEFQVAGGGRGSCVLVRGRFQAVSAVRSLDRRQT